jgi:Protein of unknown function (DUF3352)
VSRIIAVRRPLLFLLAALLALPLAACGGGGGGGGKDSSSTTSGEGGAAIVPKTAPLLIRLDTTFDSPQWTVLNTLLQKFPDGEKLFSEIAGPGVDFEQDVKPALGPETDQFALNGQDLQNKVFLGATQPRDPAKFESLLAKDENHPVSEEIDGWQVVADKRETIDRYKLAKRGGTLADSADYKAAIDTLPPAALATVYVDGPTLSRELAKQAKTGSGSGPVPGVGRISWLAGAVSAEEKGFALDLRLKGDELEVTPFTPELPAQVPADVALFVDLKGLDATLEEARRTPALQKQLGEAQKALGGLIDEVIALFKGETAITVRPVGAAAEYTLVVTVEDEAQASATLDKLATLIGAFTQSSPEPVSVGGIPAHKLSLGTSAIYYTVFDGKLVVTNAEGGITGVQEGPRLADSQAYKDAAEAAGLPDQSTGIVYADVPKLLPLLDKLAKSSKDGKPIPPEVKRNLEPLSTALLYGSVDGDVLTVKGFASVR